MVGFDTDTMASDIPPAIVAVPPPHLNGRSYTQDGQHRLYKIRGDSLGNIGEIKYKIMFGEFSYPCPYL